MNVLMIFMLLFLFTLHVKGSPSDSQPSMETNLANNSTKQDLTSSSPKSNITNTTELQTNGPNYTSVSITTASTSKPTAEANQDLEPFIKLDLKTIFIFLLGVICSTLIFSTVLCFVIVCRRCGATQENTDKQSIILEAVRSEHDQSMKQADESQADEQKPLQTSVASTNTSALNSGTEEELKFLKEPTEGAEEVADVNYATINYSLLSEIHHGELKPPKAESDYAEIQVKMPREGEEAQTFQDGVKQDEVSQGQGGGM